MSVRASTASGHTQDTFSTHTGSSFTDSEPPSPSGSEKTGSILDAISSTNSEEDFAPLKSEAEVALEALEDGFDRVKACFEGYVLCPAFFIPFLHY